MATRSVVGKIAAKQKKAKQKIRIAMAKKSGKVDVKAAKAKNKARIKAIKKASRR